MEAIFTVFAFGSAWFFLVSALWVIMLFYWVGKEYIGWSGFNVIWYLLFLEFIVHQGVFGSILHHPVKSLIILVGYLVLGFVWSFIKWWLFVNKKAIAYKEKRYNWLVDQRSQRKGRIVTEQDLEGITLETPVPSPMLDDWKRHIGYGYSEQGIPKAIKHKKTISHWVLYWPVSALWSLLDDFMGKMVRVIVVKIRAVYDKMTAGAFKNIEKLD